MVEGGEKVGLALEAPQALGVLRAHLGAEEFLDGDVAAQRGVGRPVDLPITQGSGDPVVRQRLADNGSCPSSGLQVDDDDLALADIAEHQQGARGIEADPTVRVAEAPGCGHDLQAARLQFETDDPALRAWERVTWRLSCDHVG